MENVHKLEAQTMEAYTKGSLNYTTKKEENCMKASLHNLGCKVNAYETEAMAQELMHAGYTIVPFTEKADVYIINTCTVTNMADRKSRQMLHRAKKMNPDAVVVAAGCYAQEAGEELLKDKGVDLVVGNNRKHELASILEDYFKDHKQEELLQKGYTDIAVEKEFEETALETVNDHTRAAIKIQDGCNQFCSYCIIPYARGRVRSRKFENILEEVTRIAKNGFQEVVLTGIHLSSYGIDQKEDKKTLLDVIVAISQIEGIRRIRLGSLEPRIITDEFVQTLTKVTQFCPHFHLSLQSGCDATLKRMNRKYSAEEYYEKCLLIRKYFPDSAITTDVIVGFPGETEEEFAITKAFVNKVQFYEMHVFQYSRRKGTRADAMEGQVPEQIKAARSKELIAIGNALSSAFRDHFIGRYVDVLFEEEITLDGSTYFIGHTPEYVKVAVQTEEDLGNQIRSVKILERRKDEIMLAILGK